MKIIPSLCCWLVIQFRGNWNLFYFEKIPPWYFDLPLNSRRSHDSLHTNFNAILSRHLSSSPEVLDFIALRKCSTFSILPNVFKQLGCFGLRHSAVDDADDLWKQELSISCQRASSSNNKTTIIKKSIFTKKTRKQNNNY